VKGRGAQKGICLQFRGKKMLVDTIPKVQIDIVTEEPNVRPIVDIILKAGHTGKVGDGKIFVTPVEIIASVRSGEIIE
jgi:nitrogen regulatory protein P-II 1